MVYRKISNDLKEAALRMKARGRDDDDEICKITGFCTRTLYRARRRKLLTGSVAPAQAIGRGRPRSLLRRDCDYLLRLARHTPTLFLDEYARRLQRYRELSVCITTIHRSLERAGLNVKRIQKMAAERDPVLRADFIRRIGQYPAHYLLSIDEVSKDDRTYARLWGRAPVGRRAEHHAPFVRKRRYSMIASLALDEGIVASRVLEGSFTHETFLEYLRDDVLPITTPFPGPRSVLLLDNARIHHSQEVTDLVHSYGCRIEYLPPYSPDYQPIEQAFSVIKSHLRSCGLSFFTAGAHYYELYLSCEKITPEMTWGFFRHAGYV